MSVTEVRESTKPARLIQVLWMPRPESLTVDVNKYELDPWLM